MNGNFKAKKIVFLGTPDFAIPSLSKIYKSSYELLLVITQPDKPAGRGNKLKAPAVKVFCQERNVSFVQTEKLGKDRELIDKLKALNPDLFVTCAFGQILTEEILSIPKFGTWNIHASLLPRWRGAAPIQYAIASGDGKTGITIMFTEKLLDAGNIISQIETKITEQDNLGSLSERLSLLGAELLLKTLNESNLRESVENYKQDESLVTYASKVDEDFSRLDFDTMTAVEICRKIRSLSPFIGSTCLVRFNSSQIKLKIFEAEPEKEDPDILGQAEQAKEAGILLGIKNNSVKIGCKDGYILAKTIQPENKSRMNGADWFRGLRAH